MHDDHESMVRQMRRFTRMAKGIESASQKLEVDALTGLATRAKASAYIESQLELHQQMCVIVINLVGFREINERWGYGGGDQILTGVARRLKSCLQGFPLLCRWEADKFLIVTFTDPGLATEQAAVIQRALSKQYSVVIDDQKAKVNVTASAGVATAEEGDSLTDLLARAQSTVARS